MSRKRNNLSQSISSLSASIPDIPVPGSETTVDLALGDDDTLAAVSPEGGIKVTAVVVGDHTDHDTTSLPPETPLTTDNPLDLFTTWSLTPEGHRVRDSRVPTDPVRLGCILDDNARIAFLAGYAAATPAFE